GKPTEEPEFPGARTAATVRSDAPRFPADIEGVENADLMSPRQSSVALRADDIGALTTFVRQVSSSLREGGFSEDDDEAFRISLRELVDNVANHVDPQGTVRVELNRFDRRRYMHQEELYIEVSDGGPGFDFDNTLGRLETDLLERDVEHGLLRAYRLGSYLAQVSTDPHIMGWTRERVPQIVPLAFKGDHFVPFVFSYKHEAVRIANNMHTFLQLTHYQERSQRFWSLVFDPLQRPSRPYVGIEVIGQGWTGVLSWQVILDRLLHFG